MWLVLYQTVLKRVLKLLRHVVFVFVYWMSSLYFKHLYNIGCQYLFLETCVAYWMSRLCFEIVHTLDVQRCFRNSVHILDIKHCVWNYFQMLNEKGRHFRTLSPIGCQVCFEMCFSQMHVMCVFRNCFHILDVKLCVRHVLHIVDDKFCVWNLFRDRV